MELTRLTAPLAKLGDVASLVSANANMVVLECSDADTVMAAATKPQRTIRAKPISISRHEGIDITGAVSEE